LMKKAAAHAEQLGMLVHRIPCSSDPDSLDGILIPEVRYAVVDGTAPHIVEPQLCGCGERYIDLGSGYDTERLQNCRPIFLEIQQARQRCYPKATACLKAAAALEHTVDSAPPLNRSILRKAIRDHGTGGKIRTVFLSGHTPQGRITFWETVQTLCPDVYLLRSSMREITAFLRDAVQLAVSCGYDCLVCDSSLLPGTFWEHILIPELGLAFVSDSPLSPYPGTAKQVLGSYPDCGEVFSIQKSLLRDASLHLQHAREYHSLLETGYAPYVDFTAANLATLDCCAELEALR